MTLLVVAIVFYILIGLVFFTLDVLEKEVVGKNVFMVALMYFIIFPSMLFFAMIKDTANHLRGKRGKKSL